jgi:predicted transcriptional regulator
MVGAGVGRVIVVEKSAPRRAIGILTRSDLLTAHEKRIHAQRHAEVSRRMGA